MGKTIFHARIMFERLLKYLPVSLGAGAFNFPSVALDFDTLHQFIVNVHILLPISITVYNSVVVDVCFVLVFLFFVFFSSILVANLYQFIQLLLPIYITVYPVLATDLY